MNLLLYEWQSYLQYDLMWICREQGISFETFQWKFEDKNKDESFVNWFFQNVETKKFDAIMSINYWPLFSEVAQKSGIKYIAWCYDNPLNVKYIEKTLANPANYVFCFDKIQADTYIRSGFDTVYYLPLGVNKTRLEDLRVLAEDQVKFEADVSLVGSLYESHMQDLRMLADDWTKGYLDAAIAVQQKIYGCYLFDEMITDKIVLDFNQYIKEKYPNTSFQILREALTFAMASEVTRNERLILLSILGRRFDTRLYSFQSSQILKGVSCYPPVDYVAEMPKVFACTKINLNPTLRCIQSGIPLRALDIMGAGGFLLSNYQPELAEQFVDGQDMVLYESMEDAVEKAEFYLKHDDIRQQIARNGRKKVMEEYSLQNCLCRILEVAGLANNKRKGYMKETEKTDERAAAVLRASAFEAAGDREGMFQAIQKGLEQAYDNYELYYMLGYYYLQNNIDQAYLCFQNALFYCQDEEDSAVILADMKQLKESEQVSVKETAIVIVSYNSCYLMQKNIESIRQTLPIGTYRIIVVDNASDDGVFQWLQEQEDILLLRNEQNIGFAPACNQGADLLQESECADYDIFLLNNDTRLAPNSLFWLKMGLYEQDDIGATGSCSNYAGNDQQLEVEFSLPAAYLEFAKKMNVPVFNPYEERVRLSGFAMLIRRQAWDAAGGMDADFAPGYFEDDDLSMKLLKTGYRLLYCKNSFVYHAGSQSFSKHPQVNELLIDHYRLFIQKHGFDILEYAQPDWEMLSALPCTEADEINILQVGSGIGTELKCIRTMLPRANAIGVETNSVLYEISAQSDMVFPSLSTLFQKIDSAVFHVLLINPAEYGKLNADDREILERVCRRDCTVLSNHLTEIPDPAQIKLVIWDMDHTFWEGMLSEGGVRPVRQNLALLRTLTDCGVVNSISSKNDRESVMEVLREWGVDQYFVFSDINWQNKGEQIQHKLVNMHLRAENVLFLDDDIRNLEEAKFYNPGIMTGQPNMVYSLLRYFEKTDKTDLEHRRLESYRVLEQRQDARRTFSNNEDFLYHSEITLEVCEDCLQHLDRIAELVSRTNQLNYTKNRDGKDELTDLIADESIRKGYIKVRDCFGDYGIVGFFCYEPDNQHIRHFLFSCRVMGMGIEQCVYRLLEKPCIDVAEPVASQLDGDLETPWIHLVFPMQTNEGEGRIGEPVKEKPVSDEYAAKENKIKILLKGPCDMDSIAAYLAGGNVTEEFNFVNDQGFITTGQNHSMHIWESANCSRNQLEEIVREVPFITMDDFHTSLFTEEYHVICYSLLPDCHAGLYRNRRTGAYISFGSRNFDLTAPEHWSGYIDGSIVNHAFPFSEEILRKFAQEWEFVGSTSGEDILRNLEYMYTHALGAPMFILLLGSEIEYEGISEEFAGHAPIHKHVNDLVKEYASNKDRIKVIETTRFIRSQEDYADCINHFSRNVYYDLATVMCSYINELVEQIKGNKR